ncbi:MAG: hypothetical protein IK125_03635 [Lachnospiraceae bacterium]|nr:hypothetical protein [Lachnospiraceae bacterium]
MVRRREIKEEINVLEERLRRLNVELTKLRTMVPKGARLRAVRRGNVYQYFMRVPGVDGSGKYLDKRNRKIAEILAQIEYDEKLEDLLSEELEKMKLLESVWENAPAEIALQRMAPGKRSLVKLPFLSDEAFIRDWREQKFDGLGFEENYPEYYTRKELRVRSKSEVIIADILDEMSVPFLYEKPLRLGGNIVHPDFTLLNIKERREVYWEHFGMMDDMDYRNNAFLKIRKYEADGMYQHGSMIWTFETGKYPLNTREIRKMVKNLKNTLGY